MFVSWFLLWICFLFLDCVFWVWFLFWLGVFWLFFLTWGLGWFCWCFVRFIGVFGVIKCDLFVFVLVFVLCVVFSSFFPSVLVGQQVFVFFPGPF